MENSGDEKSGNLGKGTKRKVGCLGVASVRVMPRERGNQDWSFGPACEHGCLSLPTAQSTQNGSKAEPGQHKELSSVALLLSLWG